MLKILELNDEQKNNLINNRWNDSQLLWEVVRKTYEANEKIWLNKPDWLSTVPKGRSKARDNRTFLATESVICNVTARPSKPNIVPANETEEAGIIADDLQDFFLAKYRDLGVKGKMRMALRNLFLSRLFVLKVFWDKELDDFNTEPVDPRTVRFSKNATSIYDTEFAIEEVSKPLIWLLENFEDKKEKILEKCGYADREELAYLHNPDITYKEAWIGGYVIQQFQGIILDTQKHPYWDWDGQPMTTTEMIDLKKFNGKNRREKMTEIKGAERIESTEYESYLFNHFNNPIPPYVFGTILNYKKEPIGQSSLIEQVEPLQEEIDRRKRQISDNAEMMNGVYKVDTRFVKISKAEAQLAKNSPRGIWYGEGVRDGVIIETGKELPSFIINDLNQSVVALDNIFGTQSTFRGEREAQETATGRAILREQSYQRLDELIDLIDNMHHQLYSWWYQMMRVKYTESHLVKPIGAVNAERVINLTRDDLQEGVEIQIIPGQIMPEDRLFKAERAKEEVMAGILDPLSYFEETQRDNPMKYYKRFVMYKLNPLSLGDFDQQEMAQIQQTTQFFGNEQGDEQQKAQQVAELRQRTEQLVNSPEFQKLPDDQKRQQLEQIKGQFGQLSQAK